MGQEPVLFDCSIRDNIRLGHPDANDADIEAACREANAMDFIQQLPDKLETMVRKTRIFPFLIYFDQGPMLIVIVPFFSKEHSVLCVLFRSFKKNGTFFAFFSVLLKRTERSLRSFPFF